MPTFSSQTTQLSFLPCHRCNRNTLLSVVFFLTACSGGLQAQTPAQVTMSGPSHVRLGGHAQYSALGVGSAVVWSVNGFAGGTSSTGPISTSGMYSPASTVGAGRSVTISAAAESKPASSASLKVRVLNPLPIFASGSVTQTAPGSSFLLVTQGSGFVSASQLQVTGASVATIFISSNELQSTISLPARMATVNVGVFNPEAEQKTPVSQTLPVQAAASSAALLTISPASVAFGNVAVNTPTVLPVTLTSAGTAPVTINSGTLSGAGYTMSGATFPVTLNPNLAVTLDVQFDPTATGAATGQLTIQSNSSTNGTVVISLSGTGENVSHEATLSWEAPSSSADPIVGYHIYRSPGGSSAYQLLNSSADVQTAYVDSTVQAGVIYDYYVTSVDSSGVESVPSNEVAATIP
jgi:Abnormal spindle-like microcephaly-assoc'd, ASPM-SPD-2-Hydin